MENTTETTEPEVTQLPTPSTATPVHAASYTWMAWLGFCASAVTLVGVVFYKLLLALQKNMVSNQKLFTLHPSFLFSFFLWSASFFLKLLVNHSTCGIYTLKGRRWSCKYLKENTDPSCMTSLEGKFRSAILEKSDGTKNSRAAQTGQFEFRVPCSLVRGVE